MRTALIAKVLTALVPILAAAEVAAQDNCRNFSWLVGRPIDLFDAWGGVMTVESLPAGRYQIALSEDAWVEAIQENVRLPLLASRRTRECHGVRRSIEAEVKGEPLILQLGGAGARRISIAVVRLWSFEWPW